MRAGTDDPLQRIRRGLPASVLAWQVSAEDRVWDPESIFEYIDGHAEVYLAYGMRGCLSRRYLAPDGAGDLVLDVFWMGSPEDAYGVFTYDREGEPVGIGNDSLLRHGWLSFWKGEVFVSIYGEDEGGDTGRAVLELGRAVAGRIADAGAPPAVVEQLPEPGLDPSTVRFLRHHGILSTHLALGPDNVLQLGPDTAVAVGCYRREAGRADLALARYPTAGQARRAAESAALHLLSGAIDVPVATTGGEYGGVVAFGSRVALVVRADSAQLVTDLLAEATTEG